MDDVADIQAFYDRTEEEEEERLTRHQLEWDLTWRHLSAHLPERGEILEVGAATGRYTRELAGRGYRVTAVDLSPRLTEINRSKCEEAGLTGRVRHVVADARDLRALRGARYDAALVMGPLYHLILEDDRRLALRQVHSLLTEGAPLVTAWICRLGILGDLMRQMPHWATLRGEVESVLTLGHDSHEAPKGGFRGYFCRVEELAPLHEAEGFETTLVAAAEPAISADDEAYNRLEGEERRAWLDLLFRVSTEPSLVGGSRHLLYVGHKRGAQR